MLVVETRDLPLFDIWSESDPARRLRLGFAVSGMNGAVATSVAYFEVAPGNHTGLHKHTAEETHLILGGSGEIVVGEEKTPVGEGTFVVAPALVLHDVHNTGSDTLRGVVFLPAAAVVTTADEPIQPRGERTFVNAEL